jgi:hypothetical protein
VSSGKRERIQISNAPAATSVAPTQATAQPSDTSLRWIARPSPMPINPA